MDSLTYGLHWFRRDLRIAGNLALQRQFHLCQGNVLGIFCFDHKFLSRRDFSVNRFQFFLETLKELKQELREMGSDLLVLDIGPEEGFQFLFDYLKKSKLALPSCISYSRDYEPYAIKRDQLLDEFFSNWSVPSFSCRDHLLIEPMELEKPKGEGYQVYTPFSKKWLEIFSSDQIQARLLAQEQGLRYLRQREKGVVQKKFHLTWKDLWGRYKGLEDHLNGYLCENSKNISIEIPQAGSLHAYQAAKSFRKYLNDYSSSRDFPSYGGNSKLSIYLKNGSLSIAQVIKILDLRAYSIKTKSQDIYLSELIWREFYYHVMYRNPKNEKQAFYEKFRHLKWENNRAYFNKWKEGKTGFPIVDAGMRELKQTGLMHNRVRMIVASFLTKDLLIDWRWGERYFMQTLLDGDLAPNNGGWQWAASTGCDPQPYFRIFNPWSQSKKFDPNGIYIKRYLPELKDLDPKKLHEPILDHPLYPEPIVDHRVQRIRALKLYKGE